MERRLGLIGGTALEGLASLPESYDVETPYGPVPVSTGNLGGSDLRVFFTPRHGPDHSVPPHLVNYRGLVSALHSCGVSRVIGVHSVGSLHERIGAGALFVASDFIDLTWRGGHTFFHKGGVHVDFTEPFCPDLRKALLGAAATHGGASEGTYACTQGPRLETPAEVRHLARSAEVVGMTLCPEAALAREREMCYASLAVVANWGAGMRARLSAEEVAATARKAGGLLADVVREAATAVPEERSCVCSRALAGATVATGGPK